MKFNASRTLAGIALVTAAAGIAFAPTATAQTKQTGPTHEQLCDQYGNDFDNDVNAADKADKAGNTQSRDDFLALATIDLNNAQAEGCDWAAARTVPTYPARKIYLPQGGAAATSLY